MISVVICSHNPRPHFLKRTLDALKAQTLSTADWELLLIDNVSKEPLTDRFNLSWHPRARHLVETTLGIAPARARGIRESRGDLIQFVDDDNVLAADYLARAAEIGQTHPWLGVWGGQLIGEFEVEPPSWARPHLRMLAIRELTRDHWGNSIDNFEAVPPTAGMCLRRHVGQAWVEKLAGNPVRIGLGRKGESLGAAEDSDLAFTACDLGLGTGVFVRLRLTHLISKERLELSYFERLAEGMVCSHVLLQSLRHPTPERDRPSRATRWFNRYRRWRMSTPERCLEEAMDRGRDAAFRILGC